MFSKALAHLRRQWMGALALFFVLTGGTAAALDGHNTVFSDDITDGEVNQVDLADAAVTNPKLRDNAVTGAKVRDASLTAVDFSGSLPVVVARAAGSSSVPITAGGQVSYPLSDNAWVQAADETDVFAGQVTFEAPSGCTSDEVLGVRIFVDGEPVGRSDVRGPLAGSNTADLVFFGSTQFVGQGSGGVKFEPGSSDARRLRARIFGGCSTGDITVTSLKVNVIGFR